MPSAWRATFRERPRASDCFWLLLVASDCRYENDKDHAEPKLIDFGFSTSTKVIDYA